MSERKMIQWCDFVRGVADPESAERLRDRLAGGSASTRGKVEALRHVATVGQSDSESPVPPSGVRIAKAIAGTPRADAAPQVRRVPCLLAFDNLLEAAPAGTRSLQQGHRELTFEAQGYSVDMRLEQEIETPSAGLQSAPPGRQVVVGQLLRLGTEEAPASGAPEGHTAVGHGQRDNVLRPVTRAPVFVFSGDRMIGKSVTGHHGEFQVEGLPRDSLDLCLMAGEDFLELPLAAESSLTVTSEEDAA